MYYLRLFAVGCVLATLIILTGCGSITEVPVGDTLTPPPSTRGEPSTDADASPPVSIPDASPAENAMGAGADGQAQETPRPDTSELPVCPSHFACDEGPANGCRCAVCSEVVNCSFQAYCRCPDKKS